MEQRSGAAGGVGAHSQPDGWRVHEAPRSRSGARDVRWRAGDAGGSLGALGVGTPWRPACPALPGHRPTSRGVNVEILPVTGPYRWAVALHPWLDKVVLEAEDRGE